MFTVVLYNSLGGELDRKTGNDLPDIFRQYADEGCLDYGDKLVVLPEED